jgi:hypothetical protein
MITLLNLVLRTRLGSYDHNHARLYTIHNKKNRPTGETVLQWYNVPSISSFYPGVSYNGS